MKDLLSKLINNSDFLKFIIIMCILVYLLFVSKAVEKLEDNVVLWIGVILVLIKSMGNKVEESVKEIIDSSIKEAKELTASASKAEPAKDSKIEGEKK